MMLVIHKDLSYAVEGACFDVHNTVGPLLPEKFYQAALAIALEERGIRCEREKGFVVFFTVIAAWSVTFYSKFVVVLWR